MFVSINRQWDGHVIKKWIWKMGREKRSWEVCDNLNEKGISKRKMQMRATLQGKKRETKSETKKEGKR